MFEPIQLVSIIMPACNEAGQVRRTVASARRAMGRLPYEIIVVDDQSTDGCSHGLARDVLVIRTERRAGATAARQLGFQHSRGDILVWTDSHCRFPRRSLRHLARVASFKEAIVQPKMLLQPHKRARFGGQFRLSRRGLRIDRPFRRAARHATLFGSVYAMRRRVYQRLGGWPQLPGVWGYQEQAMSLMAWFLGVPIVVDTAYTCTHISRKGQERRYSVSETDRALNAHFVHALFFPQTYEGVWRPLLDEHFGFHESYRKPLTSRTFRQLRRQLRKSRVRTEEDFFDMVLDQPLPQSPLPNRAKLDSPNKPFRQQLVRLVRTLASNGQELRGAELGVHRGKTSALLLQSVPRLTLWMVDPWAPYEAYDGKRSSGNWANVAAQQECAEDARRSTEFAKQRRNILAVDSITAARQIDDGSLDFVFIDADHRYEAVKADLQAWYLKIRPGGLLTGHDYGSRLDRKGVWGVKRAVDEFAQQHGLTVSVGKESVWYIVRP